MSENFLSGLLSKLHADWLQLRGAAHLPDTLHELVNTMVAKLHDLEGRLTHLENNAHVDNNPPPVATPPAAVATVAAQQPTTAPAQPAAPLDDFTQCMMASGNPLGAGASIAPGGPPAADPQPEFRDGNVHRFEGPGSWDLVADRKCGVRFSGGESGGVPGPVTITVSVNGVSVFSEDGPSTFYDIPLESGGSFPLESGDRVSLSITGRSNLGMNAVMRVFG